MRYRKLGQISLLLFAGEDASLGGRESPAFGRQSRHAAASRRQRESRRGRHLAAAFRSKTLRQDEIWLEQEWKGIWSGNSPTSELL